MTTITCIIASFGEPTWKELGLARAVPSARDQGFDEVIQHHGKDLTLAQARNEAAAKAKSEWLVFLDADDELEPGFADAMREAVKGYGRRPILFTPAVIYQKTTTRAKPKFWPRMDFKVGNWCIIGTMIRRRDFLKIGGFREYYLYEDYALWAMAEKQLGAEVVEVPDAIYVAHFNRKSRNRTPAQGERFFWHQQIGADVWPESFEQPTDKEVATHSLSTTYLRRIDS